MSFFKRLISTGLLLAVSIQLLAQKPGRYTIGYADTVLFNDEYAYQFKSYDGQAPLFVQIWHPLRHKSTSPSLTFGQLRNEQLSGSLAQVYQQLEALTDSSFREYHLLYTIDTEEEIGYDGLTQQDLLEEAKLIPTKAHRSRMGSIGKHPVVIYHHGSQGISDENYLMAEYFASRGYTFISANFHLPLEGRSYGSIPWGRSYFDTTAIATLTDFALELAGNQPVYAIGHSWGAQVWWHYLKNNRKNDGFVSLETTLEFKSDTAIVMDRWPELYQTLQTGKGQYNMPVLLMAATEHNQPFNWFGGCSNYQVYCSPTTVFHHESYTSAFFSRYFLRARLPQPDEAELERQYQLYLKEVEISFQFLQSIGKNSHWNTKKFTSDFFISEEHN